MYSPWIAGVGNVFVVAHGSLLYTVKHVISDHSKIDTTKILITNGSLMKVESIADRSSWNIILQYLNPALSDSWS